MAFRQTVCLAFFLVLGLAATAPLDCPPFWTHYDGHCDRFFGSPKTWQVAEGHCRSFFTRSGQGHLASVHGPKENDFLRQMCEKSLVPNDGITGEAVWIGMNDQTTEGSFVWSDRTGFAYQAWLPGQPDDGRNNNEDCGIIWRFNNQVGWNDSSCSMIVPYICKMPTHAELQTTRGHHTTQ